MIMLYVALFVLGLCQFGNSAGNNRLNTATTQQPSPSRPKPTQINDADYWDQDDFVPFRDDRYDSFDWRLLKEIVLSETSNVVFSPFSVKFVLSLLSEAAGAESITKRELSTVLPDVRTPALIRDIFKKIFASLQEPNKNYVLNVGSRIFVDQYIEPRQRFSAVAEAHYDAKVDRLNFQDSQATTNYINRWCSNITNGNIRELVTIGTVESAVMVIANAIFFDGIWRKPFIEENSFNFVFYKQPREEIQVKYMTQQSNFYYFESKKLNCKIIRLPYKGKKFSMTIILPGAKGGLNELIREIEGDSLKRLQWFMEEVQVKVTIPSFKFDYTSQLREPLENLGIHEIFTANASLPGLARGEGTRNQLRVSHIIQKSGLVVNEKGTIAFSATEIALSNKFGDTTVHEFDANRPFMFIIEDETTGTILFAGKVTDPTKN